MEEKNILKSLIDDLKPKAHDAIDSEISKNQSTVYNTPLPDLLNLREARQGNLFSFNEDRNNSSIDFIYSLLEKLIPDPEMGGRGLPDVPRTSLNIGEPQLQDLLGQLSQGDTRVTSEDERLYEEGIRERKGRRKWSYPPLMTVPGFPRKDTYWGR